jgi:hypothetical protein
LIIKRVKSTAEEPVMDRSSGLVVTESEQVGENIPVTESERTRESIPATESERIRESILRTVLARVKRLHLRLGIWLPVGGVGVLALGLTILYSSLATAERGSEESFPGVQAGNPAGSAAVEVHDSAEGLRGSLREALRRGLRAGPGEKGER